VTQHPFVLALKHDGSHYANVQHSLAHLTFGEEMSHGGDQSLHRNVPSDRLCPDTGDGVVDVDLTRVGQFRNDAGVCVVGGFEERQSEACTAARSFVDFDASAVAFGDLPDDCQAEA
jgi:hypothetical protein